MVEISPFLTVMILNVNALKFPIIRVKLVKWLKIHVRLDLKFFVQILSIRDSLLVN